jgi:hypothetical protein
MATDKEIVGEKPTRVVEANGLITEEEYSEPKIVISFGRKVQVRDYENAEAFVSIQVDGVKGADANELSGIINNRFGIAKAQVYAQLGIDSDVDPETGIVAERLAKLANAELVSSAPKKAAAPRQVVTNFKPRAAGAKKSDGKEQYWEELAANPSAFWDNRDTKTNPKAPDFKHKDSGEALWLDSKPEHINV